MSSPQVEWLLPDRRIEPPQELQLGTASARLIEYTSVQPGRTLEFHPTAKDLFDSYSVMFNTRVSVRRKNQDADAAAEEGVPCVSPSAPHRRMLHSIAVCVCVLYIYIYTYIYVCMCVCVCG